MLKTASQAQLDVLVRAMFWEGFAQKPNYSVVKGNLSLKQTVDKIKLLISMSYPEGTPAEFADEADLWSSPNDTKFYARMVRVLSQTLRSEEAALDLLSSTWATQGTALRTEGNFFYRAGKYLGKQGKFPTAKAAFNAIARLAVNEARDLFRKKRETPSDFGGDPEDGGTMEPESAARDSGSWSDVILFAIDNPQSPNAATTLEFLMGLTNKPAIQAYLTRTLNGEDVRKGDIAAEFGISAPIFSKQLGQFFESVAEEWDSEGAPESANKIMDLLDVMAHGSGRRASRKALIHLAHKNPNLRGDLLPILNRKANGKVAKYGLEGLVTVGFLTRTLRFTFTSLRSTFGLSVETLPQVGQNIRRSLNRLVGYLSEILGKKLRVESQGTDVLLGVEGRDLSFTIPDVFVVADRGETLPTREEFESVRSRIERLGYTIDFE